MRVQCLERVQLQTNIDGNRTLKHVATYSPLIAEDVRRHIVGAAPNTLKDRIPRDRMPLSQLPHFLNNTFKFDVPVYTVWGACEDVQVLEKLRSGEYKIDKLHIIDEAHTQLLELGGVKIRLLGLGGAIVMHKLFDNGEGRTTIAGGQGTMWMTLLQMGELVDTASRVYDPTEIRVLLTHASPAREGILNQLCVNLKVDFSISAGLHFRYGSSYNEFSVNPTLDHYRGKLAASRASFNDVWETVKSEVEPAVQENEVQARFLANALDVVHRMPSVASGSNPFGGSAGTPTGQVDEVAFKNMWNFNLADSQYGHLVLEIDNGRIGTEMKAQGFNFAHRIMKAPMGVVDKAPLQDAYGHGLANAGLVQQVSQMPASYGQTQPSGQFPQQNQPQVKPGQSQPQQQQQQQTRPPQQPHVPGGRGAPSTGPQTAQPRAKTPSAPNSAIPPRPSAVPATSAGPAAAAVAAALPKSVPPTPPPQAAKSGPVNVPADKSAATDKAQGENKVNGAEAVQLSVAPTKAATPVEKKPSSAIFVMNVNTDEEVRNLFSEEDRSKIIRVDKQGRNFVTYFSSPEEMQAVLKDAPLELKKPSSKFTDNLPHPVIKVYEDRSRQSYNSGGWNNNRGGMNQAGYRGSTSTGEGEGTKSGRGGASRGSRGAARGDNGRGRGRGRGTYGKADGEASSSGATPAPTSTTTSAPAASGPKT